MGWTPGGKTITHDCEGYSGCMLGYLLALGSPTHPVGDDAWQAWTKTYDKTWGEFHGQTFLNFAPMFGHQSSHTWVDFPGIPDAWGRSHNMDSFANSRRATYSHQASAVATPAGWHGSCMNLWGLTASTNG